MRAIRLLSVVAAFAAFLVFAQVGSASTALSAGTQFTCSVTPAGGAQCWGNNDSGQLGDGTSGNWRFTPGDVTGLTSGVSSVSAGGASACAIVGGAIKCWGVGGGGRLGNNATTNRLSPVSVSNISSGATEVSVGSTHACAIVSGAAKCWGVGSNGQMGNGSNTLTNKVPVDVTGMSTGVTAISAGASETCAIKDGGAYCWGAGVSGQLGNNGTADANTPQAVTGLGSEVSSISVGSSFACAVKSGDVWCWGADNGGQLGIGATSTDPYLVPQQAASGNFTSVSAGKFHACALKSSGAVWCWGSNSNGQTGASEDGYPVLSATEVTGATGVTSITTGDAHTCAQKPTGVLCWGYDEYGQLGMDSPYPGFDLGSGIGISVMAPTAAPLVQVSGSDNTPPAVTITAPLEGASTTAASVTLEFTATDASGTPDCDRTSGESVALTMGANAITVTCTDAVGNAASATVNVTRSPLLGGGSGPHITITSPVSGSWTNALSVPVEYTVTDDVGGVVCNMSSGAQFALSTGDNSIEVSCANADSEVAAKTIVVHVDRTAPTLVATNNNAVTGQATYQLAFTVSDDRDPSPSCDHQPGESVALTAGTNSILVTCHDEAGNVAYLPITITRDVTGPEIDVTSPISGVYTNANSVVLHFTASDISGVDHCNYEDGDTLELTGGDSDYTANNFVIVCYDLLGNSSGKFLSVNYDVKGPTTEFDQPTGNFSTYGGQAIAYHGYDPAQPVTCVNHDNTTGTDLANYTAPVWQSGDNSFTLTCTDGAGNQSVVNKTWFYDPTPPTVTLTSPATSNSYAKNASILVHFTATDNDQIARCVDQNNNQFADGDELALSYGVNTLSVTCFDRAGNGAGSSFTVTRDDSPPVIDMTYPTDGLLTNSTYMIPSYSVSDGSPYNCNHPSDNPFTIAEGPNAIDFTCTDLAGNQTTVTRNVTVDLTPPTISIDTPTNNAWVTQSSVPLTFSATDANGIESCTRTSGDVLALDPGYNYFSFTCTDKAGNQAFANRTVLSDTTPPSIDIYSPLTGTRTGAASMQIFFSSTDNESNIADCDKNSGDSVALSPGDNTISVTCTNVAGLSTTSSAVVHRDTVPPQVTITSPVDGSYTKDDSATLEYVASDDSGAYTCDEDSGTTFDLSEGDNELSVTCHDDYGNSTTVSTHVIRDTQAPTVVITSPDSFDKFDTASVPVEYVVTDALDPHPSCNHDSGDDYPLASEGLNDITISCTDAAGNTGSYVIRVSRFVTAPTVEITSPAPGAFLSAAQTTVTYTLDDPSGTASCSPQQGGTVSLPSFTNTITVTCTDGWGRVATDSRTVHSDTGAPVITFDSPTDNAVVKTGSIELNYSVSDIDSDLTCNHDSGDTASGIVAGANTITVQCTDRTGHVGTADLHVTGDGAAPTINWVGPADGGSTTEGTAQLIFTATDDHTNAPTCNHANGDLVNLAVGDNAVSITCSDAVGNSVTVTRHVTRTSPSSGGGLTPQAVKPTIKFKSDKLTASFKIPAGATTAQACSGKVSIAVTIKGVKKPAKATARYTGDSHICTATGKLKLAKKYKGKKAKATITFSGNAVALPFKKTYSFKIK